ncbi:hypothetical protein BDU57DRAFT_511748 [Ampelomyces quisqualis]|uniref:Glycosyl transferase CAP10 domain-containing protein n=1 Tax=Ampelomyces quisqualis TaxID=50730 RepID=A0A6A5QVN6_AMPQU|nr:hypothetical protein BDU57DRAFT_511748 [Ampelomyces quisqualis]
MHPAVSLALDHGYTHHHLAAPLLLSVFAPIVHAYEPVQHSLLITAISWGILWLPAAIKAGVWPHTGSKRRRTSWLAGALLALAHICDGAACDKEGTWATKSLLPVLAVLISGHEFLPKPAALPTHAAHDDAAKEPHRSSDPQSQAGSFRILAVVTFSATVALAVYSVPATSALGLCSTIFAATGLVLLERAARGTDDGDTDGGYSSVSANGAQSAHSLVKETTRERQLATLRDVAAVLAAACGLASLVLESSTIGAMSTRTANKSYDQDWGAAHDTMIMQRIFWTVLLSVFTNALMYIILCQHGAVHTSLLALSTFMFAKLHFSHSIFGICFTIIFVSSASLYTLATSSSSPLLDTRSTARSFKRLVFGVSALSIGLLLFQYASGVQHRRNLASTTSPFPTASPPSHFQPVPLDLNNGHPATQLVNAAEIEFQNVLSRQSTSLASAVSEYRRRYGIAPPPHFDKWYEFAVRNNVVMIDEYDMINEMLLPFWAIKPATIRSRITRELGGEDSALIGVAIRNGAVVNIENGEEWQRIATTGMVEKFVKYLPDMDLGFNIHDEPRVVVSDSLLAVMVNKARDEVLPRVAKDMSPRNTFSGRPGNMNDGKRFEETYVSNFNRFAHQQTWTHSRLSCPIDSQAQTYDDYAPDNLTAYATGPLQYVYNTTAFSDICISPSLSSTFGFFERPNAFNIIHELVPIFSQSKISSFQDILYPSPWYWAGKVVYDADRDTTWANKTNALYWRGSTTGGFSRNGGWRRQHRQHVVQRLNAPDKAQLIDAHTKSVVEVDRRSFKHLIDVHFSNIGQCDPGDCDAQQEFFHVTDRADGQNAWYFKHLLDMDGNAFSGRFYSFLKSHSLTYKMAIFREWHAEWLKPWVHYIPLSLRGDEHLDLVNWFSGDKSEGPAKGPNKSGNGDSEGEKTARNIAQRSTDWHDKVLRNVDFEAWFFRLLLEYGRIVDDNREEIGYPGP